MATAPKEVSAAQDGSVLGAVREDACLVAGVRAGSQRAFADLVAAYQQPIFNLALRIVHNREDAKDIAQEVFLKAYRQIPKMQGELHLRAWLYKVAMNACYDHLRARSRRPVAEEASVEEASPQAVDSVEQAEIVRLFGASLASLTPRQQAVLLLKDVHGLPHSEIAESLGISRGSAEVLLFRARHSFRRAFEALVAEGQPAPVCHFAEHAAAYSVGGRLTDSRRQRILEHARTCPDCRKTIQRWTKSGAVGLGLAIPLVAAPEIFGSSAAVATALGAASAGAVGATAVGAAAAGTAVMAGSTAASSAGVAGAGGLVAKLAGLGAAKAAAVVLTATTVVSSGAVAAYEIGNRHHHAPAATAASAAPRAHVSASRGTSSVAASTSFVSQMVPGRSSVSRSAVQKKAAAARRSIAALRVPRPFVRAHRLLAARLRAAARLTGLQSGRARAIARRLAAARSFAARRAFPTRSLARKALPKRARLVALHAAARQFPILRAGLNGRMRAASVRAVTLRAASVRARVGAADRRVQAPASNRTPLRRVVLPLSLPRTRAVPHDANGTPQRGIAKPAKRLHPARQSGHRHVASPPGHSRGWRQPSSAGEPRR